MVATLSLEKRNIDVRLVLLSRDLSLTECASLWDGADGPGWVSVFSAGLGCAFRGKDARSDFRASGYVPALKFPLEN